MERTTAGFSFPKIFHTPVTRTTRMFYVDPAEDRRAGWYLRVRGGRVFGPFVDRAETQRILARLIKTYLASNDTGGRR